LPRGAAPHGRRQTAQRMCSARRNARDAPVAHSAQRHTTGPGAL